MMEWSNRNLVISCIFIALSFLFIPTHGKPSALGICMEEVPTIDLLSPEDRLGEIPKGNGSKPGLSVIHRCCKGYRTLPSTILQCEPICELGCENATCGSPNNCDCIPLYIPIPDEPFKVNKAVHKCMPACPISCLNGKCVKSRIFCQCNPGYENAVFGHGSWVYGKYCEPVCTQSCGQGGHCIKPETCICKPGYAINNKTMGCDFHCEGGCGHGFCSGPSQCSCEPGYISINGTTCTPDCPRGCKNGVCSAIDTCTCTTGWKIDKTGTECIPQCSTHCVNADCVAPDTCACKKDYVEGPGSDAHNCVPICPYGCEHGVCTAPYYCVCNPGFKKDPTGQVTCIKIVETSWWG